MDVKEALQKRRAYRALGPAPIDKALMDELAGAARLMPSCFNNQPWKFVFVKAPEALAGDRDPDGTPRPPREGVFTWVVKEREGEWRIRAAQNTHRGNLPSPAATQ